MTGTDIQMLTKVKEFLLTPEIITIFIIVILLLVSKAFRFIFPLKIFYYFAPIWGKLNSAALCRFRANLGEMYQKRAKKNSQSKPDHALEDADEAVALLSKSHEEDRYSEKILNMLANAYNTRAKLNEKKRRLEGCIY